MTFILIDLYRLLSKAAHPNLFISHLIYPCLATMASPEHRPAFTAKTATTGMPGCAARQRTSTRTSGAKRARLSTTTGRRRKGLRAQTSARSTSSRPRPVSGAAAMPTPTGKCCSVTFSWQALFTSYFSAGPLKLLNYSLLIFIKMGCLQRCSITSN